MCIRDRAVGRHGRRRVATEGVVAGLERRGRHRAEEVVVVRAALVGAQILASGKYPGRAEPTRQTGDARRQGILLLAAGREASARAAIVDEAVVGNALLAGELDIEGLGSDRSSALIAVGSRAANGHRVVGAGRGGGRATVPVAGGGTAVRGRLIGADHSLGNTLNVGRVVVRARRARARAAREAQRRRRAAVDIGAACLLYTSPSPRDRTRS